MSFLQDNIDYLDELRDKVKFGLNAFQIGVNIQEYLRIKNGGDWTNFEILTGILNISYNGDKYGDKFYYTNEGKNTENITDLYIEFHTNGLYRIHTNKKLSMSFKYDHKHLYDAEQAILSITKTNGDKNKSNFSSKFLPDIFSHCPHTDILRWNSVRQLDFYTSPINFKQDVKLFCNKYSKNKDIYLPLMGLMTHFANLPNADKDTLAQTWDDIANILKN